MVVGGKECEGDSFGSFEENLRSFDGKDSLGEGASLVEGDTIHRALTSDLESLGGTEEDSLTETCSLTRRDDERNLGANREKYEADKSASRSSNERREGGKTHGKTDRARTRDDEDAERVGESVDD